METVKFIDIKHGNFKTCYLTYRDITIGYINYDAEIGTKIPEIYMIFMDNSNFFNPLMININYDLISDKNNLDMKLNKKYLKRQVLINNIPKQIDCFLKEVKDY